MTQTEKANFDHLQRQHDRLETVFDNSLQDCLCQLLPASTQLQEFWGKKLFWVLQNLHNFLYLLGKTQKDSSKRHNANLVSVLELESWVVSYVSPPHSFPPAAWGWSTAVNSIT